MSGIEDEENYGMGAAVRFAKDDPKAAAFLAEVIEVCRKHGMSIAHEDSHGAFIVEDFREIHAEWLKAAFDERIPRL